MHVKEGGYKDLRNFTTDTPSAQYISRVTSYLRSSYQSCTAEKNF